jgi:tetratricopeptide (TPR) repeat protein
MLQTHSFTPQRSSIANFSRICRLLVFVCGLPSVVLAQSKSADVDPRVTTLYEQARTAQSAGDRAGAIAKYEAILKIAPRLGAAYNNLGALYLAEHDYAKAASVLQQGLKVDPKMASASALLGVALYESGDYTNAEPRLEAAVRANPNDDHAELFLGYALVKLGDYEGAAAHFQRLAKRRPEDQEVWYQLGNAYMKLSEQALRSMNEINPNSVFAHEMSGEIMQSMKNYDGALLEYKKAVEMAPEQPGTHYKLADAYWTLAQWDPAAEHFKAELANDPKNCLAQWKLGNILIAQNQRPEEAVANIEKALTFCPRLVQARVDRARVLLKLQRYEEAVSDLQSAQRAGQENEPAVHFLLAQAYRALGRSSDAKAEMATFSKLEESARAAAAQQASETIRMKEESH